MSALLGSSLDYEETLPRVVRLAVPVLGDLCAIDLLHDDSELRRVACAHVSAPPEPLVHELGAHPTIAPGAHGIPAVIRPAGRCSSRARRAPCAHRRAECRAARATAATRPESWSSRRSSRTSASSAR
jgi:hypothetical protein